MAGSEIGRISTASGSERAPHGIHVGQLPALLRDLHWALAGSLGQGALIAIGAGRAAGFLDHQRINRAANGTA